MPLIVTTGFGLEAVAARELSDLGYEAQIPHNGRVVFTGDLSAICRANLWLRTADRVLVQMGQFEARDFGVLFEATRALPWEQWIPADAAFPVRGRSHKSQLSSVPACQRIVKKAIVERLLAAHGVSELPESGPGRTVEVALLDDLATLTLDTTGPGLNKRGYRPIAGKAPLRETLAAALVLLSVWRPDRPLVDPFCGTGTIPIEAAMIGRNLAPGLGREFASEQWSVIPKALWASARLEAKTAARDALPERIIGSDVHAGALQLARRNAVAAGVAGDIHFQQGAFADLSSKREYGCVICNPPYGVRLGEGQDLSALYRSMPDVFRRLPTWSHFILTAMENFEKLVGQSADRRRKLYSGRIECTYYQFLGPKPPSLRGAAPHVPDETPVEKPTPPAPTEQAFGGLDARADDQADMFVNRLRKRARHFRRWPKRGITCYRLYDRDIPEVPFAVDWYDGRLHISEYDRPHDRTPAEHADWIDRMVAAAGEALDVAPEDVFVKRRQRQRGLDQYDKVDQANRNFLVTEAGLTFRVNLSDYLDTGLFLDHRLTRERVRSESAGKNVLNLFCYTGAFTVYAAAGGAARTTSVDLSRTYLDWAKASLRLNGLDDPRHEFVRDDAMSFLDSLAPEGLYDLAVVDPPTFSNSKRTDDVWDVLKNHASLLRSLLVRMRPGGVVYFSTNARRFKLAERDIPSADIEDISDKTIPEDFRNQRIHQCWRITAR